MTQTKHYLCPNGITRSIIPTLKPSFNEWQSHIRTERSKMIHDSSNYFDREEDSMESIYHQLKNPMNVTALHRA
jgi:hypothetical protein